MRGLSFAVVWLLIGVAMIQAAPTPILLDTDLGDGIDDALALALVLSSPELDLQGITTVTGDAHTRALIACRLLHLVGRPEVPIASAQPSRQPPDYRGQMEYGLRPAFRKRPEKAAAVEFLYQQLKARPGELTLLCIGPLTNIAELVRQHPDCKPWIKRVVIMGGAVRVGYNGEPPAVTEWNMRGDIAAAQTVFGSGLPLWVCPLDATRGLKLKEAQLKRVLHSRTPLSWQLLALYQLWEDDDLTLWDPAAVALSFDEKLFTLEDLRIDVDDQGLTRVVAGKPNARVATAVRSEEFLKWFTERVAPEKPLPVLSLKLVNPSEPIARGGWSAKVHVIEDYETDLERHWWLAGKPETTNVPPGSKRACRGVLTNDFDDLQGDPKGMYTAVIFNPVPGPPMGPNTRLSFRCWLKGTDRLRVQIYSLSNGYHRCLTLTNLPRETWQDVTVDMTKLRRPDGSGGPLSADERIDDIQFYTEPDAELIVDDVVLYDAAATGEKRPFPKRPLFTGWFDTGKQGQEWPGSFAIVPHQPPLKWKAAQSVPHPDTGHPCLQVHLRGERPLGETTHLTFRYHVTGADSVRVELWNNTAKEKHIVDLQDLKSGMWSDALVDFSTQSRRGDGSPCKPRPGDRVSELRFHLPKGAELRIDDLLLFEPGS